jgi:hypothetical protein
VLVEELVEVVSLLVLVLQVVSVEVVVGSLVLVLVVGALEVV